MIPEMEHDDLMALCAARSYRQMWIFAMHGHGTSGFFNKPQGAC
jgi:hypothetical protein